MFLFEQECASELTLVLTINFSSKPKEKVAFTS